MPKWITIVLALSCVGAVLVAFGRRDRSDEAPADALQAPAAPAAAAVTPPQMPAARAAAHFQLHPQEVRLRNGSRFTLRVPQGMTLTPAAEGLGRARFMARSPDGR